MIWSKSCRSSFRPVCSCSLNDCANRLARLIKKRNRESKRRMKEEWTEVMVVVRGEEENEERNLDKEDRYFEFAFGGFESSDDHSTLSKR